MSTLLNPLIGNTAIRARLWRAADENRLHHCYLFEGPEGVGKFHTAMQLALYVNCRADEFAQPGLSFFAPKPVERPCGTCPSCASILAGSHPDVVVVNPDPQKATRIISTEQARALIASLSLQRHSARRRFVILDPADALNEESANALLKTLEEPPSGTQIILNTSRAASLLQTVRSRSQRVRFGPIATDELELWLQARGLDPRLATVSMGSPGKSLALSEGGTAAADETAEALCRLPGQPLYQLFAYTETLGKKAEGGGEKTELVLDVLEELLRDTVQLANGRPDKVLHRSRVQALNRWVRGLYPEGIGRLLSGIAAARDRLRLNVNGRVVLEALLSQLSLELSQAKA